MSVPQPPSLLVRAMREHSRDAFPAVMGKATQPDEGVGPGKGSAAHSPGHQDQIHHHDRRRGQGAELHDQLHGQVCARGGSGGCARAAGGFARSGPGASRRRKAATARATATV